MSTVYQGSTLSNPHALNEEELREALTRANDDLIRKDIQIAELYSKAVNYSNFVGDLCELALAGKFDQLSKEIAQMAESYKHQKAAFAARKVH